MDHDFRRFDAGRFEPIDDPPPGQSWPEVLTGHTITANAADGQDAHGGHVESLTEAVRERSE